MELIEEKTAGSIEENGNQEITETAVVEQVLTTDEPPIEELSAEGSGSGGFSFGKAFLGLAIIAMILSVLYASYIHLKASEQHLSNERMVAEQLAKGLLEIKTRK